MQINFTNLATSYGQVALGIRTPIVVGGAPFSARPCFFIVHCQSGIAPDWRHVGWTAYFNRALALSQCESGDFLITGEEASQWQYEYYCQNPNAW